MEKSDARKSQHKLLLIILTIIFVMIAGYTTFWEIRYYTKYYHFKSVSAEVVDHETEGEETFDVLKYYVDGVEYYKTTKYVSKNEIGDEITIYYDVNSPIGVIYKLDYRRYAYPIIAVMMGAVCIAFFVMYKITYPKTKKEKVKSYKTPAERLLNDEQN